ncbi:9924_t:CDS:2 [Diversispora eburnea]|uniref:rRNA-processing protein EFG1 n=1 Tax=Diversispora eburnea TaxID=1213867 RepID=A0A9N8W0G1_9GLOM|nr:9924_t:CDS:2 [Diversispora eburnea]
MPPTRRKITQKKKVSIDTMSISAIRKKIHDIERSLRRENLTAKIQVDSERKLKAYNLILIEKRIDSEENKMSTKYRKVKHFDRVKTDRKIKKTERQLLEIKDQQEKDDTLKKLFDLQVNRNYIIHFPKSRKYLALYPTSNGDDPNMIAERNEIKDLIKKAMEKNDFDSLNRQSREEIRAKILLKIFFRTIEGLVKMVNN